MHCCHPVSNVSRPDWSLICHSQRKKSQNTSNCSFFPLLPPFFSPQSFFHHPLQVCDRLQTGWEGRTMCCDPRYCPPAQCLAPTPSPSRQWGAWPPPLRPPPSPPPPPPPPLPPESIALRHHTNDPWKSMHHSTVHHQQWPAMWLRTEREGARIRWRVTTGKYKIGMAEESEKRMWEKWEQKQN